MLGEVNEAMIQIWDEEKLENVWDLNCLVYSGALTAMGACDQQDGMTEKGDGESSGQADEVEDPEGERAMRSEKNPQEADPSLPPSNKPYQS